jgi:hypothetical protein
MRDFRPHTGTMLNEQPPELLECRALFRQSAR